MRKYSNTHEFYKPDANTLRSNVPEIYKWGTKDLFATDEAFKEAFDLVVSATEALLKFKGKLTSPSNLKDCLDQYFNICRCLNVVVQYSMLKSDENVDDNKYQEIRSSSIELVKNFQTTTSFIRIELMKLDDNSYNYIISSNDVGIYKNYIRDIRRRKDRLLSEDAEKVLSLFGDTLLSDGDCPHDGEMVFRATMQDLQLPTTKDEKGNDVQLTLSNLSAFRSSVDRNVRKNAMESFFSTLRKYQNTLASSLSSQVKFNVTTSKIRKYDNTLSAFLDSTNVNAKAYDNLVSTIGNNVNALHEYVDLKAKALGIDKTKIYDLYAPITKEVEEDIPYEKCIEDIKNALMPLGSEYTSILNMGIKPGSGWIDVYPNKGKDSGGYCSTSWGKHPFIKLNYLNKIDQVFTTAHEYGHALHSYLNNLSNPYHDAGYRIFTGEIASTFNEVLLEEYYLDKYKNDKAMKLYLLGNRLENIRSTVFRQTMFSEFERNIHKRVESEEPISSHYLCSAYKTLLTKYFGKSFDIGKNDDMEWAFIPHFYYKYYVYTYATGLCSGIQLAQKVLSGDKDTREKYLNMLKQPSHKAPVDILKEAGVDMTKPEAILSTINLFRDTIKEVESLLD